jgi:hypothetical protein
MRSQLGSECRKLFRNMMASEFPEYRADKSQAVPQGWYVWTCQHSSGIFFHIMLVIRESWDKFTVEGGWSLDGKLQYTSNSGDRAVLLGSPSNFLVPNLLSINDRTNLLSQSGHFTSEALIHGGELVWSIVLRPTEYERSVYYPEDPIEDCIPLVGPAVQEAGMFLKKYLIPFFAEVIERQKGQS